MKSCTNRKKMPRERKTNVKSKNLVDADGEPSIMPTKAKKRRSSLAGSGANAGVGGVVGGGGGMNSGPPMNVNGPGGQGNVDLAPPMPSSYGETIFAGNPFDDAPPHSTSTPTTPTNQPPGMTGPGGPLGNVTQITLSGSQSNLGGMQPGKQGNKPVPMMSGKIYPPDQRMVFNPTNPNAPPVYPCGICHKEVHESDQGLICESGCGFFYHRACAGLTEYAFNLISSEVFAEWACDKCLSTKKVPLIKFKP